MAEALPTSLLEQAESTYLRKAESSSGFSNKSLRSDFRVLPYHRFAKHKPILEDAVTEERALNTLKDAFKKKSVTTLQCFLGLRIDQFSKGLKTQDFGEFLSNLLPQFKSELDLFEEEISKISNSNFGKKIAKLLFKFLSEILTILDNSKHGVANRAPTPPGRRSPSCQMERIYCEMLMDSALKWRPDDVCEAQRDGFINYSSEDELSELFVEFTIATKQLGALRRLLQGHESLLKQIKAMGLAHVQRLAIDGRVDEAVAVLKAMECQVIEEVHSMVLETSNPAVRHAFHGMLMEQNRLSYLEKQAWKFFFYFDEADPAKLAASLRMWAPCLEGNLTLKSFLKLSDNQQQKILVHTTPWSYVLELMELCTAKIVWEYLIETRNVKDILKWAEMWVSRNHDATSVIFPYTLPVTQGMIEQLEELPSKIRDGVLNQLAVYGLFTTNDCISLPRFLRRTLASNSVETNFRGMEDRELCSLLVSYFLDRGTLADSLYFLERWPHLMEEMERRILKYNKAEATAFWKLVTIWKSEQQQHDLVTYPNFLFLSILLCCFRRKKNDAFVYLGSLMSAGMFDSCTPDSILKGEKLFEDNIKVNILSEELVDSFDVAQAVRELPALSGGLAAVKPKPAQTRGDIQVSLNNENNMSVLNWVLYYLQLNRPAFASIVIPEAPPSAFFRHLFNFVLGYPSINMDSAAILFFLRGERKYAALMSVFSKVSKLGCESSTMNAVVRLMDVNNVASVFLLCNALTTFCSDWAENVPKEVLLNLARRDKFLAFLIVGEIYDILPSKVMQATKEFSTRTLRSHLLDCLFSPTTAQLEAIEKMETPLEELLEGPLFFPEDITEASVLPWQYLEYEGLRIGNPTFILLAASKTNNLDRKDWLCKYLSTVTYSSAKDLDTQLIMAVDRWEIRMLRDGFCIFMPEKRVTYFLTWIVDLLNGQDDSKMLNEFEKSLATDQDEESTWEIKKIQIILVHLLRKERLQGCTRRYLLKVFCEGELRAYLTPDTYENLKALLAIESIIQFEAVTYSVSAILTGIESCEFKAECEKIFHLLVQSEKFDRIQQLAQFVGMSVDTIVLEQFSQLYRNQATESSEERLLFWCWCSECFEEAQVNPTTAVLFFLDHASQTLPGQETLWVLNTAFMWLDKVGLDEENQLNSSTYQTLEKKLWPARLDALKHGNMLDEFRENKGSQWKKVVPRSELEEEAGIPKLKIRRGYLSRYQVVTIEQLLTQMLCSGHVARALRLSTLFQYAHTDIENLLLAMDIAEGKKLIKDVDFLPSGCHDAMSALQYLTARSGALKYILSQITACFHLASLMDLKYKYVVSHPQPQQMFNIVLKNNQALSKPLLNAFGMTPEIVAAEVSKEIMHRLKNDDGDLMNLLDICVHPCLLGSHLLQEARNLSRSDGIETIKKAVKAMVFAHSCFMKWCNIQGVSGVLCTAPYVFQLLEHHKLWNQMVDLLIGIGHYDDMRYVFTMLKRNDVLEEVLRKKTEQDVRLRTALVDYVKRGYPEDAEMLKLVALHFCMYGELAEYWKEQAQIHVKEIISSAFQVESLRHLDGSSSIESVVSAMRCWSHCAEYYIQAGKFEHADKASRKAQLCALQTSFCDSARNSVLLLDLNEAEFHEISRIISFEEAMILNSAYPFKMNWASALCYHLMEKENMSYLESLVCNCEITGELVQMLFKEITAKYHLTPKIISHIESLISLIPSLSVRYRLASQLGIHSYSEILLDSPPDEAYLKDTCYKVKDSTLYY